MVKSFNIKTSALRRPSWCFGSMQRSCSKLSLVLGDIVSFCLCVWEVFILIFKFGRFLWRIEMPRASKKQRFHGTPYWKIKQAQQENGSEIPASLPDQSVSSDVPDQLDSSQSDEELVKETASTRKLETCASPNSCSYDGNFSSVTYRLVELRSLMQAFQQLHKCKGGRLVYNDEQAKRYGNSSLLHIECTKCKH